MKPFITLVLTTIILFSFAQEKEIHVQGRITDINGNPVSDVYIINYRSLDKNVSRPNGVFDFVGLPSDSMIFSHVAFHRKVVKLHALLLNPLVVLDIDSVRIKDITISPEMKTDYELAKENLQFLQEFEVPEFEKIKTDNDRLVHQFVTEHNRLARSEATSITFIRFSPSDVIGKIF